MANRETDQQQALLVGHAALSLLLGLLMGFGLTFSVLGEIRLWPFPAIGDAVPGAERAWRAAHIGPMLNGIFGFAVAWAAAAVLPLDSLRFVVRAMIVTIWGNACFYLFSMLGTNRGLSLASERYGEGNVFDGLAYVPAVIAAFAALAAMAVLARGAFRARRAAASATG